MAFSQTTDFPFNYAIPDIEADSLVKTLPIAEGYPFAGYDPIKKKCLALGKSPFWKNLGIWHFNEGNGHDERVYALFEFDDKDKLTSIQFSSTNLAEIHHDDRPTTMEDYFVEYGNPIMKYLQQSGWEKSGNPSSFPFILKYKNLLVTISVDTLYDVAINPEADHFSGFHYHYPEDHIPSANKYLRFKISFS